MQCLAAKASLAAKAYPVTKLQEPELDGHYKNVQGRRLYRCEEIRSLIAQQVHGDACIHAYSYYGISVS